jgi:hypothetical protein
LRLPEGPPLPFAPPCNRQRPFFVAGAAQQQQQVQPKDDDKKE